MSLLLDALNKAAADRAAAQRAAPGESADVSRKQPVLPPVAGTPDTARAAMENTAPPTRGLWLALALALLGAGGFGLWMRGVPPVPADSVLASSVRTPAPSPPAVSGPIPAALRVSEAGPLQLRLDRQLDSAAARTH